MCRKITQTTLCQYIGKLGGIDRAATIEKFGYDPDTLSRRSGKKVVAVCKRCGKARDVGMASRSVLCASCAAKKRFEDPEMRKRHSAGQKKRFEDPIEVMKSSERVKKRFEDPKAREKICIAQKKRWEKPEEHVKCSIAQKKRYEKPEVRRKASEAAKKRYREDPKAHGKASEAAKKYYKNNPYTLEDRKRISARLQNIPYEEWKCFAKDVPYCPKFDEACRESNREKYGRVCFICGLPESENVDRRGKQRKLAVHHVDLNKNQGCDGHDWQLIPTCIHHHGKSIHSPEWIARIIYLLREWDTNID